MTGPAAGRGAGLLASRRAGTVTAVNTGPPATVTITLGGDTTTTYDAPYLESYRPVVGDTVAVLSSQGAHLVLGHVGAPGHADGYAGGAVFSTASGTFIDVTGVTAAGLVKRADATRLRVDLRTSWFLGSAGATAYELALAIDGTDYSVVDTLVNPVSTHTPLSVVRYVPGVPAGGPWTAQLRIRRISGSGTLNQDASDYTSIDIDERP